MASERKSARRRKAAEFYLLVNTTVTHACGAAQVFVFFSQAKFECRSLAQLTHNDKTGKQVRPSLNVAVLAQLTHNDKVEKIISRIAQLKV